MRFGKKSREQGAQLTNGIELRSDEEQRESPSTLWSDSLGRLATRSLQLIIVIIIAAVFVLGVRTLSTIFIPIVLALIFACAFWPVTKMLRARGVPHALIATLELLSVLVILSLVGWLIVWAVQGQWEELAQKAQQGFGELITWVQTLPWAPDQQQLEEWRQMVIDFITTSEFGAGAIAGVSVAANFVTGLVLMLVVLFFFLKDGPKIWRFLQRPFEGRALARAQRAGQQTVETLGSYIRGTSAVALADAIGIGVGLVILDVPLALPLALLVFLFSFIPFVGAVAAGALAALVALVANGPLSMVLVIGVVILVNQLEGNFLQPVLMGRVLRLHALVILLALASGAILAGVLGAVLAVPIVAVVWRIIKVWDGPDLPAKRFRAKPGESEA